jgi:lipid II:glycine glycyltransferase (peptidoglycan interpeptide bridge formation enzyme)
VWVARRDGEPIAATVVLTRGSRVTYWRGAMDKDRSRGTGANELIHRHAIEAACTGGYHSYDFGLSQTDDLRRFKASFGTQEVPVHMYFFERLRTTTVAERGTASAKQAVRMLARTAGRR